MASPPEKRGEALWGAVRSLLQGARLDPPLRRSPAGAPALLSPQQKPYWCPERPEENGRYLIPMTYRIPARVEPALLERSLVEIARRHEVLRTAFRQTAGEPRAVVLPETLVRLPVVDLRTLPEPLRQACTERLIEEEARQVFRLDRGPLVAFKLLLLGEDRCALLATFHHAVFDGWSLSLFSRDLSLLYEAFTAGRPSPLSEPPLQYADFARWKEEWLQGPEAERQRAYWRQALRGLPRRGVQDSLPPAAAIHHVRAIPADLIGSLRALGESAGATLFITLLAAFKALLWHHSGEEDLCLYSIMAGRTRRELGGVIGCFLTWLALRASLAGDPTFRELLQRVRESALGAFAHPDLPWGVIWEDLAGGEAPGAPKEILFLFQNFPAAPLRIGDREVLPEESASDQTRFPLIVTLNESGDAFTGEWDGHGVVFDAHRLAALAESYEAVLRTVVANPEVRLSGLPPGEGDLIEILTLLLGIEES